MALGTDRGRRVFNALEKIFGAANANRRNPASIREFTPRRNGLISSAPLAPPVTSSLRPPSSVASPQPSALSEGTEGVRCAAHWRRSVPARARGARMVAVGMGLTFGSWDSTASPGRTSPRRLSPVCAGEEQRRSPRSADRPAVDDTCGLAVGDAADLPVQEVDAAHIDRPPLVRLNRRETRIHAPLPRHTALDPGGLRRRRKASPHLIHRRNPAPRHD